MEPNNAGFYYRHLGDAIRLTAQMMDVFLMSHLGGFSGMNHPAQKFVCNCKSSGLHLPHPKQMESVYFSQLKLNF
jgi:hypothetical protein